VPFQLRQPESEVAQGSGENVLVGRGTGMSSPPADLDGFGGGDQSLLAPPRGFQVDAEAG
jgi:hypothetical protein